MKFQTVLFLVEVASSAILIYNLWQRQRRIQDRQGHLRQCLIQVRQSFREFRLSIQELLENMGFDVLFNNVLWR